jgi:glycosyltransferase involved in cell wall biosynthesis
VSAARPDTAVKVLSVTVGVGARSGGVAPVVGGSARELERLGSGMTVLATDLALAPWGLLQRQQRIRPEEWHPSLTGTDTRLFPARFPRRLAYSPALGRAVRSLAAGFDVVHIHNLWQYPQYAGYRAAQRAGVPHIVSLHGGLDPYLRERGRIRKRLMSSLWQDAMLAGARLIHVTTEAERELTADVAPEVPRAVVPCGLYVEEFATPPPPDRFRRSHLGGYDGPLILFLGRITRKKGLDVLIRAFARVRRERRCRLAVVGPDDEGILPSLRALAGELGLEDDVGFLDPVYGEDRLAALASADVWALSSHAENFGIAVVEAMAAGCAVVTTPEVNVTPEIAAAGAGMISEAEPEPFAAALSQLLADDRERERLRGRARKFARGYDWSAVGPRLLEMYREAISG